MYALWSREKVQEEKIIKRGQISLHGKRHRLALTGRERQN